MPFIATGASATFTVPANNLISVQCPGGFVQLEYPLGTKIFEGNIGTGRSFGPFASGSAKLVSLQGGVYYEVALGVVQNVPFDPTSVAIIGGVIGVPLPVTTSRNLAASDSLQSLRCNSASTLTLTLPAGLASGFNCAIVQMGAGKITVAAGAGVTLNSSGALFSTSGQYTTAGIIQTAPDEYVLSGQLGA